MTSSSLRRMRLQRPPALILGAVCLAVITHLAASLSAHGAMAAVMALMALACLGCLVHRRDGSGAPRGQRTCVTFMAMTVAMIAVHVAWLALAGGSGRHAHGAPAAAPTAPADPHALVMLAVVGVELVCLALGALALRRARALGPAGACAA